VTGHTQLIIRIEFKIGLKDFEYFSNTNCPFERTTAVILKKDAKEMQIFGDNPQIQLGK